MTISLTRRRSKQNRGGGYKTCVSGVCLSVVHFVRAGRRFFSIALVCVEDQIQAKKTSRSLAVPPAGDVDNVGRLRSSGSTAGSPGEPGGGREEGGACLSAFWVCR